MNLQLKKNIGRLNTVLLGGSATFSRALSGVLISWLVIRFTSLATWGSFTTYLVAINFLGVFISFGNKDYLVREFSRQPSKIITLWNDFFWSRSLLFLPALIGLAFVCRDFHYLLLCGIWLLLTSIQQSFDSLNLFHKNFLFTLLLELFSTGFLVGALLIQSQCLSLDNILVAYLIIHLIKAVITLYYYKANLQKPVIHNFSLSRFRELSPYFLLAVGGILLDRADLLCVTYFLPDTQKAGYQIFSNLCNMGIVLSGMVLIPFSKNIYRLNKDSFATVQKNYLVFGALFSALFMLAVYFVCVYFYLIDFSPVIYFAFFINLFAFSLFLPLMFLFNKHNWHTKALKLVLSAGIFTLLLSAILVPGFQLEGAAVACASGQVVLFISSRVVFSKAQRAAANG